MAKRQYKTWSSDDMEKALSVYKGGRLKFNETCVFNILKPTFRRHLKGLNMHEKIGRPKYLTKAMEDELVNHILELESRFFGVTIRDLRHLAYQLAENMLRLTSRSKCISMLLCFGIVHFQEIEGTLEAIQRLFVQICPPEGTKRGDKRKAWKIHPKVTKH
ncbi:hypothetical protein WA026_015784 [Henosepilachna vigintioctopunctata]|uniref:Uncharacterized protein n=1 Tax=Henosepilachna vigintioctopunctata TaxID=420089 RepID=A0AAW1UYU3_9CUCU